MSATSASLSVSPRTAEGSRSARRLRRSGWIPGVVYGGGDEPQPVQVEALTLRRTLANAGSVIELSLDGQGSPVLIKNTDRHPVTGEPMHVDFLRVDLKVAIQAVAVLDLLNVEESPGVREGGVLEQVTREVTVEALPGDIPETISFDAGHLEPAATLTLAEVTPPSGVTFVDDLETTVATITVPQMEVDADAELEQETERIGDPDAAAEELDAPPDTETGTVPG